MPLQIITLKLEEMTAGDYLTWCRDPDPPALDYALRSIRVRADPLGDTITATLDWNEGPPAAPAAATAAGLPSPPGVQIQALTTHESGALALSAYSDPHTQALANHRRARSA